ncbi:hypothetical protein SLEP1_g32314 [Rubroshorea leprosula]|uniref:Cytochrome P450 n=1 Tax=Rubroshorea leprosula TaxID=152421 RepID=A0AAV5KCW3_9ROSI|nr:hypothetical protein SLEP1_g32314 [Rubroshorea leprosula]
MIAALLGYLGYLVMATYFLYSCHLFITSRGVPKSWPLIGMTPAMLLNFHRLLDRVTEILEKSKGTFLYRGFWFTNTDFLATSDPQNVRYIMNTNCSTYLKGSEWRNQFDIFGDSLFNSDSEAWKQKRNLFHCFLNHRQFHELVNGIIPSQIEKGLIPILEHVAEQGLVVNLQELFMRQSFDLATIIVYGYNPKSLSIGFPEVPLCKAIGDAMEAAYFRYILPKRLWELQRWLQIGREKKLRDAWTVFDYTFAEYISMQIQQLNHGDNREYQSFSFLKYLTREEVTNKLMRDYSANMILAFEDTNSTVLTLFFWILSKNPMAEKKIEEKLTRNLLVEGGDLQILKEINKLVYLHAALCETLRFFPPVPYEFRTPTRSDTLPSGHCVNEKTRILVCTYAMGRMTSVWGEDCHEFKPERWITGEGKIKREPPSKFFAFMSGPRMCMGKDLAFTLMKATAASIILNYKLEVIPGQNVSPRPSVLLHMKHGVMARIKSRRV